MKIYEKISQLKKSIFKIFKNISRKMIKIISFKNKIEELNNEILRLKKGISDSVE